MRFGVLLAALAALFVQPAAAATVFSGDTGSPINLHFNIRGTYKIAIEFAQPVSIASVITRYDSIQGWCVKECEWKFDGEYTTEETPSYNFDGTHLTFDAVFPDSEKVLNPPGYSILWRYNRGLTTETAPGGPSVNFTGIAALVPEPATWLLMVLGIGMTGIALRGSKPVSASRSPRHGART